MNKLEKFEKVSIHKDGQDFKGIIIDVYPHYNTIVLEDGRIVDINEDDEITITPLNSKIETKDLKFPKLTGLNSVSLISTMLKLTEETGELSQVIGKGQAMSGERNALSNEEFLENLVSELLDVAQTTTTMMFVLEQEYGLNMQEVMEEHYKKLIKKGYIK